jgi:hypothetical protein
MENYSDRAAEMGIELEPGNAEFGPLMGPNRAIFFGQFPALAPDIVRREALMVPVHDLLNHFPGDLLSNYVIHRFARVYRAEKVIDRDDGNITFRFPDPEDKRPGNSQFTIAIAPIGRREEFLRLLIDMTRFWIQKDEIVQECKSRFEKSMTEYNAALDKLFDSNVISGDWGVSRSQLPIPVWPNRPAVSPKKFRALIRPMLLKLKTNKRIQGLHTSKDTVESLVSSVTNRYEEINSSLLAATTIHDLIDEMPSISEVPLPKSFMRKWENTFGREWVRQSISKEPNPMPPEHELGFFCDPVQAAVNLREAEIEAEASRKEAADRANMIREARALAKVERERAKQRKVIRAVALGATGIALISPFVYFFSTGAMQVLSDDPPAPTPLADTPQETEEERRRLLANATFLERSLKDLDTLAEGIELELRDLLDKAIYIKQSIEVDGDYEPLAAMLQDSFAETVKQKYGDQMDVIRFSYLAYPLDDGSHDQDFEIEVTFGRIDDPSVQRTFETAPVRIRLEKAPPVWWHRLFEKIATGAAVTTINSDPYGNGISDLVPYVNTPKYMKTLGMDILERANSELVERGLRMSGIGDFRFEPGADNLTGILSFHTAVVLTETGEEKELRLRIPVKLPHRKTIGFHHPLEALDGANPEKAHAVRTIVTEMVKNRIDLYFRDGLLSFPIDTHSEQHRHYLTEQLPSFLKTSFNSLLRGRNSNSLYHNIRIEEVIAQLEYYEDANKTGPTLFCSVAFSQHHDGVWEHSTQLVILGLNPFPEDEKRVKFGMLPQKSDNLPLETRGFLNTGMGNDQIKNLLAYGLAYVENNEVPVPVAGFGVFASNPGLEIFRKAFNVGVGQRVGLQVEETPLVRRVTLDGESFRAADIMFTYTDPETDKKQIFRKEYVLPSAGELLVLDDGAAVSWTEFMLDGRDSQFGAVTMDALQFELDLMREDGEFPEGIPSAEGHEAAYESLADQLRSEMDMSLSYYGVTILNPPVCTNRVTELDESLSCLFEFTLPNGRTRQHSYGIDYLPIVLPPSHRSPIDTPK